MDKDKPFVPDLPDFNPDLSDLVKSLTPDQTGPDKDFDPGLPDFNPDLSGIISGGTVGGGPKPGPDPGPVPPPFPHTIIPIKPEHLHPDVPLFPLEAYAIPSNYFLRDGSHAFVVSLDRSFCWPCAGRCWYDTSKGEDKTRVRVAAGNAFYDWLMLFHPPEKLYDSVGILFGYNGVCHTIANRILLVCVETIDVQKAKQADVSMALFGKLGLGKEKLKQILTNTFHEAQKIAGYEESILQAVLAKVDYPISEDVAAWHGAMVEICEMPASQSDHADLDQAFLLPELKTFMAFREDFYLNNASKMEQFEFQKVLILKMLDIMDRMLEYLRDHNYITPDEFKLYAKNASKKLRLGSATLGLQEPIVAATGRFDEEMALKVENGEVKLPGNIQSVIAEG